MSFKFSRRGTRVQRKPHVCESEPQPWPKPTPPAAPTANVEIFWAAQNSTMDVSSTHQFIAVPSTGATSWETTIMDDQGRACLLTWSYPGGGPGRFELTISGFGPPPPNGYADAAVWDGSLPFSDNAVQLLPGLGTNTTGEYNFSIA